MQAVIVEHETFDFDPHNITYPCEGWRSAELKAWQGPHVVLGDGG